MGRALDRVTEGPDAPKSLESALKQEEAVNTPTNADRSSLIWVDGETFPLWEDAGRTLPYKGVRDILLHKGDRGPMKPQLVCKTYSRILYLQKNSADLATYNDIYNLVAKRQAKVRVDDRRYEESHGGYISFISWVEEYFDTPLSYRKKALQ